MGKNSFYAELNNDSKYVINVCYFAYIINGLFVIGLDTIMPFLSIEYNLSHTVSGLLISSARAGNFIAGLFAGLLQLYLGRKKTVTLFYGFLIMGLSLIILTGNPLLLLLGFAFSGLTRGGIANFNNAVVNEVSNSSPKALGFLHGFFAVGAIVSPLFIVFSNNLLDNHGWRLALIIILIFAAITILLFSKTNLPKIEVDKSKKQHLSYDFLKNKSFIIFTIVFFFYYSFESGVSGWLVKYFVDTKIINSDYVQITASILWGAILISRFTCAVIGNRISAKTLLIILSSGSFAFFVLMISAKNLIIITLAIAGLGLFMGGIYQTVIAAAGNTLKQYPLALSTILTVGNIGGIFMPFAAGVLSDLFSIYAGMASIAITASLLILFSALSESR